MIITGEGGSGGPPLSAEYYRADAAGWQRLYWEETDTSFRLVIALLLSSPFALWSLISAAIFICRHVRVVIL